MKKIAIACIIAIILLSCKSQTNTVTSITNGYNIDSPCPEEGNCTVEVMENKSLAVKTDDTGHIYYQLEDMPGKSVIKYVYRKKENPKITDSGYSEEVIFETDKELSNLNNKDINIQKTKMLFGVHCFCRGKAGFYKIEKGSMDYSGKKLRIELPEVVDGQKTKTISITFK